MLITSRNPSDGKYYQISWLPGTKSPFVGAQKYSIYLVGEVEIESEQEKDYLRVNFPEFVIPNFPTVRYFGDDARFIAGNLQ